MFRNSHVTHTHTHTNTQMQAYKTTYFSPIQPISPYSVQLLKESIGKIPRLSPENLRDKLADARKAAETALHPSLCLDQVAQPEAKII